MADLGRRARPTSALSHRHLLVRCPTASAHLEVGWRGGEGLQPHVEGGRRLDEVVAAPTLLETSCERFDHVDDANDLADRERERRMDRVVQKLLGGAYNYISTHTFSD